MAVTTPALAISTIGRSSGEKSVRNCPAALALSKSSTTRSQFLRVLAAAGLSGTNIIAMAVRDVTASLAELAVAGNLRIEVSTVLPLEQATDGLATIASGKIVVKVSD